MTKRLTPTFPQGWAHPRLWLHRSLHSRRVLQYRARVTLIALVVLLIAVIALKLSPVWLLLALVAAALPTPIKPAASLRELEVTNGAYTTALVAPTDEFGFQTRLESQALAQQKQADLPAYPWLEGGIAAALCSLLLVFPPQSNADRAAAREISNPALTRGTDPNTSDAASSSDAPPVLDAPSRNTAAPTGSGDAKPGQAASGGSIGEPNVGDLKPGGGNASEDPAAISREFMNALERGAVRDAGSNDPQTGKPNQPQVQDNDAKAAQQGSANGDQSGSQSGNGSQGSNQNKPSQNGSGQNGSGQNKPNQGGQGNQPQQQNPNSSGGNQSGQQGNQPSNSSNGNGTQNGTRPGQSGQRNGRGNTPNPDDGQSGNGQGSNRNNSNQTTPARGARGASDPQAAQRPDAQSGKLEYLPGTVRGTQVRSGALQLPGDPRAPLTGTPGTPAYKRAAEGAVLDPKLPLEYQELLKNYYR